MSSREEHVRGPARAGGDSSLELRLRLFEAAPSRRLELCWRLLLPVSSCGCELLAGTVPDTSLPLGAEQAS